MLPKIAIHFTEGGRGDFLASVLLDSWHERHNGTSLTQPNTKLYYKMHYYERTPYPDYDCVKIRIDDNDDIDNMMQITYNQFQKFVANTSRMEDTLDHFYLTTRYYKTLNHREQTSYREYDYWIDFKQLNDIEYIKGLYFQIREKELSKETISQILENIARQQSWTDNPKLVKLSKLIDFENRNHLMYYVKNFHMHDFMASNEPEKYLNIRNYRKDGWT